MAAFRARTDRCQHQWTESLAPPRREFCRTCKVLRAPRRYPNMPDREPIDSTFLQPYPGDVPKLTLRHGGYPGNYPGGAA
jgi:hypothetical protein